MVSFKRALKNAGKKIKRVFTAPFRSKKKKITEGGNKENFEQLVSDSSKVVLTNCSAVIPQEQTQSSVAIETHSACEEISEESLSEASVTQATSTDAIKMERIVYSVEDNKTIIVGSVEDNEETIDDSMANNEITNECSTTNDVPPLGVCATDVVGEEGVVLTCISNEEIEQMNSTVAAKYSFNDMLDIIGENFAIELIYTLGSLAISSESKTEKTFHFDVNLTKKTFSVFSASNFVSPIEITTNVESDETTDQLKGEPEQTEETIVCKQNEEVESNKALTTKQILEYLIPDRQITPLDYQQLPACLSKYVGKGCNFGLPPTFPKSSNLEIYYRYFAYYNTFKGSAFIPYPPCSVWESTRRGVITALLISFPSLTN